jgi:GxxExxY protein
MKNHQPRDKIERVGKTIVHSAIKVHRALGPGLLESAYQACLHYELSATGLHVDCEVKVPIRYGDMKIDTGFRLDMLVDGLVAVENKVVERILPVHRAQLLTYLEFSGTRLGFLLNWNVALMKQGIRRYVFDL